MEHIPYKGTGPATVDLVAGHVGAMAGTVLSVMGHIRVGRLRALGITSSARSASAPDVPTISEAGLPGYEATQWYGLLAPAQTPKDIVARLHAEATRALQQPEIKERFVADGADPVGNTPEEFRHYIQSEIAKWAKVARDAGIKPE
jgi:tripartite-type tricarboxylate transporter receptor subunit TctC